MKPDIHIFGARQNNLKNIDITIHTQEILVITGVSGSGKSSLAFDTLYAEGQRRYVETFSPYARQFLDRMDKPVVDKIEGILPAIAIDQVNPVRNSRSTVGTMTELNDHLKLLYARLGQLYCKGCTKPVKQDSAQSIYQSLLQKTSQTNPRLIITFPVMVPMEFTDQEVTSHLEQQGYTRVHKREVCKQQITSVKTSKKGKKSNSSKVQNIQVFHVIQDRFRMGNTEQERVMEALDEALQQGRGHIGIYAITDNAEELWRYSKHLHCANCNIEYSKPLPSTFSFNSPIGACEHCRGFGRVIGIDYGLVIPDENKTLSDGALRPLQTATYKTYQAEMEEYAKQDGIRLNVAWNKLSQAERDWVIEGTPNWVGSKRAWETQWYGMRRFFDWLESRSYRMHVRVLLSKYRSYTQCSHCNGSRLKSESTLWRIGQQQFEVLADHPRFMPHNTSWTTAELNQLPGLGITDLMRLPISHVNNFINQLSFGSQTDAAIDLLLKEVKARLGFLCEVGLGYLTLERQSRTLSGGEVQRINLTTALGTSLVNTLFVLDEPSIGLHPRDMHKIVEIMQRLRDNGNTLVVVEHDPIVMMAADRIVDIGPGPGERGGNIIFDGKPADLIKADTLTGKYLSGSVRVEAPRPMLVAHNTPKLILEGVQANNLKNISVSIPLGRLTCLTGVSGSGKSTLVENVLYPAFLKAQGKPTEAPGMHTHLLGYEQLADIVLVDQAPIGKTARSNPASYVGAYTSIRKLFAQTAIAKERGYTAGTFSFNTGNGRCPTCGGSGFEHIEMQFLSDVYLRCPDCDGTRFRPEILEIKLEHQGKQANIADVLAMTVSQALIFFNGLQEVQRGLTPLADVGLEYVQLGQPVPTLSGGEAQRLKLAGHLAEAERSGISRAKVAKKGSLFLFDEPTTGLHFDDVARLMRAFRKLLQAGHSLLIIEHNLDVIRAADWLIELGPEGGDDGGYIVACGTPADISAHATSHTGQALRDYAQNLLQTIPATSVKQTLPDYAHITDAIQIINAREHNLKGINVNIPHNAFTVITGVSGSGKSTLAFDILFNEGQRRYLESINAYARSIVQPAGRPDVDAIYGIAPTVAIEQRTSRGGRKSTVATMTEIHHFLRLLYVKLGTQMCPDCNVEVKPQSAEQIAAQLLSEHRNQHIGLLAPLIVARKGYYTDLAKWAASKGYSHLRVDGEFIPVNPWPRLDRYKEHNIDLPVTDLIVDPANEDQLRQAIRTTLEHGNGNLTVLIGLTKPQTGASIQQRRTNGIEANLTEQHYSVNRACPSCGTSFPEPDPRMFSYNSKHGWCNSCFGTGVQLDGFDDQQTGEESAWLDSETTATACKACQGQRLNPVSLAFLWQDSSIAQLASMPVNQASKFFDDITLQEREALIARDPLIEVKARLNFMQEVGLGYLTLDRSAPTLSGGEAQRIRLAAQLGSNLQGVCYILDEPTIGLHTRDNRLLLNALQKLEGKGNTLVVVEHDEETIRLAEHIIDMGPGGGSRGGQVIAQGTIEDIITNPNSLTGRYLNKPPSHNLKPERPLTKKTAYIKVEGASLHNLQGTDAQIPVGHLTVVTGVSGSGKSTLAREVLLNNIRNLIASKGQAQYSGCTSISGWEVIDRVLEVDQAPIGKTPRSSPATYIGLWDNVRRLFASSNDSKMRGWTATRFSFNTGDGRCPICEGQGMRTIEMNFLPDVKVLCEACNGDRFNLDTLSVTWQGKNVGEILKMDIDDAILYFSAHTNILRPLQLMQDVGLGYLTLGQPSPTLSGGEAQRLKLVSELAKANLDQGTRRTGRASRAVHTLYVLDEPTVGLSMADVEKLTAVLHRLANAGNTVVVIEHNLDLIAEADYILDLGPEGGTGGGHLVVQGSPAQVIKQRQKSHTGTALAEFLNQEI